jgi:hypothetical protein
MQRRDAAAELRSGVDDGADGPFAQPLDRRQPETDALASLDREIQLALVDVGRQHGDATVAAFAQVHRELVGVLRLDGQQRRGKMPRVVGLEISGLVGKEGVRR